MNFEVNNEPNGKIPRPPWHGKEALEVVLVGAGL